MIHQTVRRWLEAHTPIEPSLLDGAGLELLIAERISDFGGAEEAYIAELARSTDEVDRLVAAVAVPETWLFRYPRSFDLLHEFLQRRLQVSAGPLRMLSIGCATGQEPYCMAMTALHAGWPADRIQIEALDRNAPFLRAAAAAEYGAASIRTEIPAWAVPFLHRSGDAIRIDPAVRALVRFGRVDISAPDALSDVAPCDVVFCRNLLIYLNAGVRDRLLRSICNLLTPGGLLFVGHAEQVIRGLDRLRAVATPHAFALELVDSPAPVVLAPPRAPAIPAVRRAPAPLPAMPAAQPNPRPQTQPAREESIEAARVLADTGRLKEAEAMVRTIIARRGPSAVAMELLGMISMSQNDLPGAKRWFEQAVYLEPAQSASLLQLALISEQSGDERRAAQYWDRANRSAAGGNEGRRS